MFAGWAVVLTALVYLSLLFAVARLGDVRGAALFRGRLRPIIYALTLAIYCTSWTFLGSVGFASRYGLDFLAIYIGPVLVFAFGGGALRRVLELAKAHNITSVADFVAARYGKNARVAAVVTAIACVGMLPYVALQLKAISSALEVFITPGSAAAQQIAALPGLHDLPLIVALLLAAFAAAFGTRHVDTTEHQNGLMLAIAAESIVKLVAFLAVGIFVTFVQFGGIGDLLARAQAYPAALVALKFSPDVSTFATMVLLSAMMIVMLPRQFHVFVVENRDSRDLKSAMWLFPLYLVLINLFVVPLALAGQILLPAPDFDRDMTVLTLPVRSGSAGMALIAFIGGLSAATAMVIVESVALAIMVSNHLIMPLLIGRRRAAMLVASPRAMDMGWLMLAVRRVAILLIMVLSYAYYRYSSDAALAAIGLMSFAAIAQIAPSLLGGMFWRGGNARGAVWGMTVGIAAWAYTMLLPSLEAPDSFAANIVINGPFGIDWLRPTSILGLQMPSLVHGTLVSLALNIATYVLVSWTRAATPIERLQASLFVASEGPAVAQNFRLFRASVSVEDLRNTIARYLGEERTARAFETFARSRGQPTDGRGEADVHTLRFAEHLLSSAIGAASSRLVLSLLLRRRNVSTKAALKLLDEASAAMQYSRDLVQHALDHAEQGVTVFDSDLRLAAWNRTFQDMFALPADVLHAGVRLAEIVRSNARRSIYGPGDPENIAAQRLASFRETGEPFRLRVQPGDRVLEVRTNALPDGGFVTTYTDVTASVRAEEALERANETLERRVQERTEELTRVNEELGRAKAQAEEANLSKTRFLAAASHDILQPLNAARLYTSTLVERGARAGADASLAGNIDASLEAVEEILTTLLDISRLDSGTLKPEWSVFRIDEIFRQLQVEFTPMADAKGLTLAFVPCTLSVRSDRRLMRRVLQNLISNAIKYTESGKVLIGCRRHGAMLRLVVADTGLGIPPSKQRIVFREFQRLDQGARAARGLGLGLSIVERISRLLDHRLKLASNRGRGTTFSLEVPTATPVPAAAPRQPAAPSPDQPLAGLVVLAIDNEPSILDGMRNLLTGWGCAVLTAADAKSALAAIRAAPAPPSVLIVDYHLDEGTGIDLVTKLRWRLKGEVRAALVTADRSPQVREEATARDIVVLNKPLKPAALRATLAQWRASQEPVAAE